MSQADRLKQIMEELNLLAETVFAKQVKKDIVEASEFAKSMWAGFMAGNKTVEQMRTDSIAYQVLRGLWLVAYGGAEPLPYDQVHLAYTVPWNLLVDMLEVMSVEEIREMFNTPGALDLFIDKLQKHLKPDVIRMWGEEEADRVHAYLNKFLNLNPEAPNFQEQLEAWRVDVQQNLPAEITRHLLGLTDALISALETTPGGIALSDYTSPQMALPAPLILRLYEAIRNSFYGVRVNGQGPVSGEDLNLYQMINMVISEVAEDVNAFGMLETDSMIIHNLDMTAKAQVMKMFRDQRLQKIMAQFGRMLKLPANAGSSELEFQKTDEASVSSHFEDLTASGYALLAADEEQFDARMAAGDLPTYDRRKDRTDGGPFILLLDNSGSMSGTKDVFSKALAMRLAERALREERPFCIILFSGTVTAQDVCVFTDPGEADRLIRIIQRLPQGGTNFEQPLHVAVNLIRTDERFRNADIVMLTDGQSAVTERFLYDLRVAKKELDFRIHAIGINMGQGNVSVGTLKQFADTIKLVTELTDDLTQYTLSLM